MIAYIATTDIHPIDYFIICAGSGMRQLKISALQKQQLRAQADRAKKVISICTGAFLLAQIYAEKSLHLTTHWRHCQALAKKTNIEVITLSMFVFY